MIKARMLRSTAVLCAILLFQTTVLHEVNALMSSGKVQLQYRPKLFPPPQVTTSPRTNIIPGRHGTALQVQGGVHIQSEQFSNALQDSKIQNNSVPPKSRPSKLARIWKRTGFFLLPFLASLPFALFGAKRALSAWYTPLLGVVAASLPSGGAPVAGGIVFLPMLVAGGLTAKQAVAFSACTQTFGCGIFAPLNWLSQNPGVLINEIIPVSLIPGVLGCLTALFFAPISSIAVEKFFAIFCVFLAAYVIHGLSNDLTTNNEPVQMNLKTNVIYALSCYIGGLITGWIGIGIEKIIFILLTSYPHKADLKRACLTSIAVVGWISFFSALVHLFVLKDVPLLFWICGLPGVFIGSKVGPIINRKLGPRNIMKVFTFMLLADSLKKIHKLFFMM